MKDRIKQYMDYKSISAGELSTAIEVQRSNISHILNGRNKPGASFIEKLLLKYPDLNARWLLTGEGEMILNTDNVKATAQTTKENYSDKQLTIEQDTTDIGNNEEYAVKRNKRLSKVVLLYTDGTFREYNKL